MLVEFQWIDSSGYWLGILVEYDPSRCSVRTLLVTPLGEAAEGGKLLHLFLLTFNFSFVLTRILQQNFQNEEKFNDK